MSHRYEFRDRATLHESKLAVFTAWIVSQGWTVLPLSRSEYERIRVKDKNGRIHIGYQRDSADHITVQSDLLKMVRRFIRESRRSSSLSQPAGDADGNA